MRELRERIVPRLEQWGLAGADSASEQEPRLTVDALFILSKIGPFVPN